MKARTKLKRWFRRAVSATLALLLLALGTGYMALRTSLPVVDGAVAVSGIKAPAEVLRDANGVPHIYAASEADAYFALGFVHAQDRLWQLEARRRLGAGRLSELLGAASLDVDRFYRTLGLYRAAEQAYAALDDDTRALYRAYADGVNGYRDSHIGLLPPEFVILGLHDPEPWRPADSLVVLKLMAWDLSRNWRDELLRARLASRLSPAQIEQLWPGYPATGPVALPNLDLAALDRLWEVTPPGPAPGTGSNNWVVAGHRSTSGRPLLANDPHLRLGAPSPFYLAHISAPGLDVVGATLPGAPGVILGRNDRIAWGFTNTGPDTQDIFVERPDPDDAGRYLAPGGSLAFETRAEVFKVYGRDDVVVEVRATRHGPVLSDLNSHDGTATGGREILALSWTALRDDDVTARAGLAMGRARNWTEFVTILNDFHGPQQNIVYADVDGNIGLYAPGQVPLRRAGQGWAPVPGWGGAFDWDGFVPYDELPRALNPPAGMVVTANNKIVPDNYPYFIARDWAPPYCAQRITQLLGGRRHDRASFRAIQSDVVSLMAREMMPYLLAAKPATEAARAARELMVSWNGEMARDRPEPLIFAAWYRTLTRLIYADELGPMFESAWGLRPAFIRRVLDGRYAPWCDDITTAPAVESCADLVTAALDQSAAALVASHGADPGTWRWDAAHKADLAHAVFRRIEPFSWWFGDRIETGGDRFTVNVAGYSLRDGGDLFAQNHGPAYRAIYDLADLDKSLYIIALGQSGNPLSLHYSDLTERWRDHRPFTIPTSRAAVDAARVARLILTPP